MLFVGVATAITAFPVLARILSSARLLSTPVGNTVMSAAAVDDVIAWCLLGFVIAITRASAPLNAVWTILSALAFIGVLVLIVRPILTHLTRHVRNRDDVSNGLLALVLVLMFLSAWTTETIGIHALFGAFAFGTVSGGATSRVCISSGCRCISSCVRHLECASVADAGA